MEIRKPKFELGQKVIDKKSHVGNVIQVDSYHFAEDEYWYDVSFDKGESGIFTESYLAPYVEKPKTVWDLKEGDTYYTVDIDGSVIKERWRDEDYEKSYRNSGNVFLTEEEAEFEVERRKVEAQMLRFGGHRKYDYERNNFCFSYDQEKDSVYIYLADFSSAWQPGQGIYFSKRENAEKALIEIGEDKIIKYLFSIDESGKTDD